MLEKIKRSYQTLGDALIDKIEYVSTFENTTSKTLNVYMKCLNWETDEWQRVKFVFADVFLFQYIDNRNIQSAVVFEALIEQNESGIVVDFFPTQVDGLGKLEEDPESSFLVHCETISYEVLG